MRPVLDRAELPSGTFAPIEVDPASALTRPMTLKAYDYWRSVCGDRAMPARKDISPQGMRAFVGHIALVELRPGENGRTDYVMRVAGARIEDTFGAITGRAIGDFLPPDIEKRWRWAMDQAVAAAAPLRIASRVLFGNKTFLQAEVLLAPLGEAGQVSMLFGAIEIWPVVDLSPRVPA
jgi:hypothetical protein